MKKNTIGSIALVSYIIAVALKYATYFSIFWMALSFGAFVVIDKSFNFSSVWSFVICGFSYGLFLLIVHCINYWFEYLAKKEKRGTS